MACIDFSGIGRRWRENFDTLYNFGFLSNKNRGEYYFDIIESEARHIISRYARRKARKKKGPIDQA